MIGAFNSSLCGNRQELQVVDFSCDEKWLLEYATEQ